MSSQNEEQRQRDEDRPSRPKSSIRTMWTGKRSRTGCFTCRARKIKCDESQPNCQNCTRCMLECKWPVVEDFQTARARRNLNNVATTPAPAGSPGIINVSNAITDHGSVRTSANTACSACRAAGFKCTQELPRCLQCCDSGLVCMYQSAAASSTSFEQSVQDHAPEDVSGQDINRNPPRLEPSETDYNIDYVSKSVLLQHIQAFFAKIYPCQANGFLHRGVLLRKFQAGRINRKLLLAICAVASQFVVPGPKDSRKAQRGPAEAKAWAKEAKTLLILDDMTTDTVATALLLARHDITCGNYGSAWMLSSIANRAALALGLDKECHPEDSNLPFSEQETRRRLFWACYVLDRMMSTGVSDLVILRTEHIHLRLPCEEHQYLYGIPCWTPMINLEIETSMSEPNTPEELQAQRDVGMFGHYVQIMQMRYCILKYVRNHPEDPRYLPPWDPSSTFAQSERKMSIWKQSLLPQFQLLPDTIYERHAQDQLSPLIMLHVWYDQCMSDLYRIVMPGFPETLPTQMLRDAPKGWVVQHQVLCVRHASEIASTFETVASLVDMENFVFLDASLPICVFESIRVQLQWLYLLPPDTLAERVEECKANFEMLMSYVESMTKDFQQAKWLLKETRRMLLRHNISIRGTTDANNSDSSSGETGSHPWQRRIQRLKTSTEATGTRNPQLTRAAVQDTSLNLRNTIAIPPVENDVSDHNNMVPENLQIDDSLLYAVDQNMDFAFTGQREMAYQEDYSIPANTWGEAQLIPSLSNFMGITGEWLANG